MATDSFARERIAELNREKWELASRVKSLEDDMTVVFGRLPNVIKSKKNTSLEKLPPLGSEITSPTEPVVAVPLSIIDGLRCGPPGPRVSQDEHERWQQMLLGRLFALARSV